MEKSKYFIYKKNKKEEPYYLVNQKEKKNLFLYDRLYPNGYFVQNKIYSAVFSVDFQNEKHILCLLRNASLDFRILNMRNEQGIMDTFFLLYEADSNYEQFDKLADYVIEELLKEENCFPRLLSLNERIRLIHRGCLLGKEENYLNVMDYIKAFPECKKDFGFDNLQFHETGNEMRADIEGEGFSMAVLGVQNYPEDKNVMERINTRILKNNYIAAGIRIFESVSDQTVVGRMKTIYMGLDSQMVKLKKTDSEFYELFYNNMADDTARYTFCGCIALLCAESNTELLEELNRLSEEIRSDGGNLVVYRTGKRRVYENIISARIDGGYTRTIYTKNLEGMAADSLLESRDSMDMMSILEKNLI